VTITADQIKQTQAAVNTAGYSPALVVDGILGPKTTAGVSWYQTQKGIPVTGAIDTATLGAVSGMVGTTGGAVQSKLAKVGAKTVGTTTGAAVGIIFGPIGVGVGAAAGLGIGWAYQKIKAKYTVPPPTSLPAHLSPSVPVGAPMPAGPPVPAPTFDVVDGESNGARIARIVRFYEGCSLSARTDELGALVGRGVDDPNSVVRITTNCAMFALGVLSAAGVQHPLLSKPYVNGMAFAWVVQIGTDTGAWRDPSTDGPPVEGAAMWYRIAGTNDDHVEFMLTPPDEHGGGGRANNAITIETGDVSTSVGRPLYKWLDPSALPMGG
jgi:putative peptidoglycan binding protein